MIIIEFNTDELEVVMFRLSEALEDKKEVMQGIGEYLVTMTQNRVLAGQQPNGQPFAPRSQTVIDMYAAQRGSYGAPLNRRGDLRKGIEYEADKDGVYFGSNTIQAAVMQFGATKGGLGPNTPWGDIPARPSTGLSDEDEVSIIDLVSDYLEQAARN